jgi:hypothetical protein
VVVADAKFWVGRGETPSPQGIRIPDENGKEAPLRKYDKKTIVLTLPGVRTSFTIRDGYDPNQGPNRPS